MGHGRIREGRWERKGREMDVHKKAGKRENRGKSIKSCATLIDILQRKTGQREETKKRGAGAINACKVRKARDLTPPPSPLFPPNLNNVTRYTLDCVF